MKHFESRHSCSLKSLIHKADNVALFRQKCDGFQQKTEMYDRTAIAQRLKRHNWETERITTAILDKLTRLVLGELCSTFNDGTDKFLSILIFCPWHARNVDISARTNRRKSNTDHDVESKPDKCAPSRTSVQLEKRNCHRRPRTRSPTLYRAIKSSSVGDNQHYLLLYAFLIRNT